MWKYLNRWKKSKRDIKEISYEDIEKENYVLIDVRSRREYLEGHLNSAINIPLSSIKKEINHIEKEKKILVYCQSGVRSKKALKILEDLGYKDVCNLKGGLENI